MRKHKGKNAAPAGRKPAIKKRIAERLDLPAGAVGGASAITIRGNAEMMVSDCEGVLLYREDEIKLKLKDFVVGIGGAGLRLDSFWGDQITVSGTILHIYFEV